MTTNYKFGHSINLEWYHSLLRLTFSSLILLISLCRVAILRPKNLPKGGTEEVLENSSNLTLASPITL